MYPSTMQSKVMKTATKIQWSIFCERYFDGGNAKLRETAITIGQASLNEILPKLKEEQKDDLKRAE